MALVAGQPLIDGLPPEEWRKRYVDTLGTTISYFLTLSTATIAFWAAKTSQPHGANEPLVYQIAAVLFGVSVLSLGVSVALGIVCSIVRLFIFRKRGRDGAPDEGGTGRWARLGAKLEALSLKRKELVLVLVVGQVLSFLCGIVTAAIRVFAFP
jgi:hypothetical protein